MLVLNVSLDHVFIQTDSRSIIPSLPQSSLWKLLDLLLDPRTTLPFQDLHCVGHTILWGNDHHQVDVVVSNVPLMNHESFPTGNLLKDVFELLLDILVGEDFSSPLWCPHQMVLAVVGTVL